VESHLRLEGLWESKLGAFSKTMGLGSLPLETYLDGAKTNREIDFVRRIDWSG